MNVVWRPTRTTILHAGYSRYFTPPPFEQVTSTSIGNFQNTSAASEVTRNDKVQPERDNYFGAGRRSSLYQQSLDSS